MDLLKIKELLNDINNHKFASNTHDKFTNKIMTDDRYYELLEFINREYVDNGYGFKTLIKQFNLPITYSMFRRMVIFMGIELHSNVEPTKALIEQRSYNAKMAYINKTGFFSNNVQKNIHNCNTKRGIQGYYWNTSLNKYVWLRSTWEFIYAKWLNKQKIIWDVEVKTYKLQDGTEYRPDFFIYKNDLLTDIVEIKGYWKDKKYKPELLNDIISENVTIIEDISPYCEYNIKKESRIWKQLRKLKLNK